MSEAMERGRAAARRMYDLPTPQPLDERDGWADTPYNRGRLHAMVRLHGGQTAALAAATLAAWDEAARIAAEQAYREQQGVAWWPGSSSA